MFGSICSIEHGVEGLESFLREAGLPFKLLEKTWGKVRLSIGRGRIALYEQ